jgi:hypothetical protein
VLSVSGSAPEIMAMRPSRAEFYSKGIIFRTESELGAEFHPFFSLEAYRPSHLVRPILFFSNGCPETTA